MPIVRAKEVILGTAVVAMLAGCVGARLSPEAPAGVRLEGAWRLNQNASDDPQKIIDQMRAQAVAKRGGGRSTMSPGGGATGSGRGGRGSHRRGTPEPQGGDVPPEEQPEGGEDPGQRGPVEFRRDPLQYSPSMHVLMSNITRGDLLTIRQSPDRLVLDYGSSVRSFTPGGHSVVSVEGGVGDQVSGWKGKEYVIRINPQVGPAVTERYGLSPDGKQLVVKLRLSGGDTPKIDLTRVYDPTDATVRRTVPTND